MSPRPNRNSPRGREFWSAVDEARAAVAAWPGWKRGEVVGLTYHTPLVDDCSTTEESVSTLKKPQLKTQWEFNVTDPAKIDVDRILREARDEGSNAVCVTSGNERLLYVDAMQTRHIVSANVAVSRVRYVLNQPHPYYVYTGANVDRALDALHRAQLINTKVECY